MRNNARHKVIIDGGSLTIDRFVDIVKNKSRVEISAASLKAISSSKKFLDSEISSGKHVYGANTGFGSNVGFQISFEDLAEHQRKLIYSLSVGTPPFLDDELVRGFLLARLNCLAKGYSGVRPEIVSAIGTMLNENILPFIPRYGSLGASGDLVPSSGLGLALMGSGSVKFRNEVVSARLALKAVGIKPIKFQPKEALAIVNNTSVMTAMALSATDDFGYLLDVFARAAALYVQVLGGLIDPFYEELHILKNHSGSIKAAEKFRKLLSGSRLIKVSKNIHGKLQDPYSIRCLPQMVGPHYELLDTIKLWITDELNSANDNPLIDGSKGKILHGGNFSGFYVGIGMDMMKILIAHLANIEQTMIDRVLDHEKNNILPPSLAVKKPGLNSGLKGVGISAGSYYAESIQRSFSHSLLSRPFESGNQDIVSFGTLAASAACDLIKLNREILARMLIVLGAAADIRGVGKLSPEGKKLYKKIRLFSVRADEDRLGISSEISRIISGIEGRKI